jgi:hypothetical protein
MIEEHGGTQVGMVAHQSNGSHALQWTKHNADRLKMERNSLQILPREKKSTGSYSFGSQR